MGRTCAAFAGVFVLAMTLGVGSVPAAGPPPPLARELTPDGLVAWNLDALLNDTFGSNRVSCYDARQGTFFSRNREGCPSPWQRYLTFHFMFRNAHDSEFRLVRPSKP